MAIAVACVAAAVIAAAIILRPSVTPTPESVEPAAIVNGEAIPMSEFKKELLDTFGQPILLEQVRDVLLSQEAARRKITIPDERVEAKLSAWISREIRDQQAAAARKGSVVQTETDRFWLSLDPDSKESQLKAIEFLGKPQHLTVEKFKAEFKRQMLLDRMVGEDLGLKPGVSPTSKQIDLWFAKLKKKSKIRSWKEGLRPDIAAVINGEEIPLASVLDEVLDRVAHKKVVETLEEMIDRKIIEQKLEAAGEGVTDDEIEREIEHARQRLKEKPEFAAMSLEQWLRSHGEDMESFKRALTDSIGLAKVAAKDIPEEALRRRFEAARDVYSGKKVRISHIFIAAVDRKTKKPLGPNAWENALKKIRQLQKRAQSGEDFAELAKKYSDAETARNGGDVGFFPRTGRMIEEIASVAFSLKKGQVSQPIKVKNGYHILKVTDIKPGKDISFNTCRWRVLYDYVTANRDIILKKYRADAKVETFVGGIGRGAASETSSAE